MKIILGIIIPFIGTSFGSAMVFFMKNTLNKKIEKLLLGLASGVMIAASVWSLLIPSLEMAKSQGLVEWYPAVIGFILGVIFFIMIDFFISKIEKKIGIKNNESDLKNNVMLFIAVTLHNIPEGMAVGVVFSGIIAGNVGMTIATATSLAIGIAIQNFPEGAIISMPLQSYGISKTKAFLYGVFSGIVEPIAAFVTILLTSKISLILPYLLGFAAGCMIYVVADELIPKSQSGNFSKFGIIGLTIGFLIMMVLDIIV